MAFKRAILPLTRVLSVTSVLGTRNNNLAFGEDPFGLPPTSELAALCAEDANLNPFRDAHGAGRF
jgi:hypothetical protein